MTCVETKPATVWSAVEGTVRRASKVGVGNAAGNDGGRGAGAVTLRSDVVEDAVVTEAGLVEQVGENTWVSPRAMLRAWLMMFSLLPKALDFGEAGCAAGDKRESLVVAETAEEIVLVGQIMVEADIEFGFVKAAYRLVDVVVAGVGVAGVDKVRGVNIHHGLPDGVDQVGWNLVAGGALGLASIDIGRQGIPGAVALEVDIGIALRVCGRADHVRIGDLRDREEDCRTGRRRNRRCAWPAKEPGR